MIGVSGIVKDATSVSMESLLFVKRLIFLSVKGPVKLPCFFIIENDKLLDLP